MRPQWRLAAPEGARCCLWTRAALQQPRSWARLGQLAFPVLQEELPAWHQMQALYSSLVWRPVHRRMKSPLCQSRLHSERTNAIQVALVLGHDHAAMTHGCVHACHDLQGSANLWHSTEQYCMRALRSEWGVPQASARVSRRNMAAVTEARAAIICTGIIVIA